ARYEGQVPSSRSAARNAWVARATTSAYGLDASSGQPTASQKPALAVRYSRASGSPGFAQPGAASASDASSSQVPSGRCRPASQASAVRAGSRSSAPRSSSSDRRKQVASIEAVSPAQNAGQPPPGAGPIPALATTCAGGAVPERR